MNVRNSSPMSEAMSVVRLFSKKQVCCKRFHVEEFGTCKKRCELAEALLYVRSIKGRIAKYSHLI